MVGRIRRICARATSLLCLLAFAGCNPNGDASGHANPRAGAWDGGDSLPQGFSAPAPFGGATVTSVSFPDARTGYVTVMDTAARGIYRSDDSGKSWLRLG